MPKVDPDATMETYEARLIDELESGVYRPSRSTPPEQIAVLAVGELQRDHPWDAAVLLALASFRRCEQSWALAVYGSDQGWEIAEARSDGRIERDDYNAYLKSEIVALRTSTFEDELSRVSAKVGAPVAKRDVDADITRLMMGRSGDPSGRWQALRERMDVIRAPPAERLEHPKLAAALRSYLEKSIDANRQPNTWNILAEIAADYLARVPLHDFRSASLRWASPPLDSNIVYAGLTLYTESPEKVIESLRTRWMPTRSYAAVILGVIADPANLPKLQEACSAESSSRVRLSCAFALAAHGQKDALRDLETTLSSDKPKLVEHVLSLLGWMTNDGRSFVSEALLTQVLGRNDVSAEARCLAIQVLHDRSVLNGDLSPAAMQAILKATYDMRDHPYAVDFIAPYVGELKQLDRARVLRALATREQPLAPWLARFVHVAAVEDIPQIERWLADSDYGAAHRMLVRATGAIPGGVAQAALEKWLVDYPELSGSIAFSLLTRKGGDKQRLTHLMSRDDLPAGALALELTLGRPGVSDHLQRALRSPELQDRFDATLAIQWFGTQTNADGVWQNIGYQDARHYPNDIRLRHQSLSALLHVELNRSGGVRLRPSW